MSGVYSQPPSTVILRPRKPRRLCGTPSEGSNAHAKSRSAGPRTNCLPSSVPLGVGSRVAGRADLTAANALVRLCTLGPAESGHPLVPATPVACSALSLVARPVTPPPLGVGPLTPLCVHTLKPTLPAPWQALAGAVPSAYCRAQGLDHCSVCGMLVAARYNGTHCRCRPAARAAAAPVPPSAPAGGHDSLPDLASIFSADIPVLRHVPKAARGLWAQCLARALSNVAVCNSLLAWRELLMLPKAVLQPAPRGGARRREQAARFTQRCCSRWLEGEREELWQSGVARRRRGAPSDEDADAALARRHARCKALASERDLSRACAALVDPPLLAESPEVAAAALQDKHPRAPPARPGLRLSNPCAALSAAVPLAPPASGVTTSAKPCRRPTLTRLQLILPR